MGAPIPSTYFAGLPVTLTETQRKATINSPFQYGRQPQEFEDWLKAQPQRFALLGIDAESYDAMLWATSQFSGTLNIWWLNRKQHAAIPTTFDLLVEELMKTAMLPNIQDDAINVVLNTTLGNMSYAVYTPQFNDFLRRSRQQLTTDLQRVLFVNGLANFDRKTLRPMPSLIDRRKVTSYCSWSCKISSTTSLLINPI
jgi:hypothetical protein